MGGGRRGGGGRRHGAADQFGRAVDGDLPRIGAAFAGAVEKEDDGPLFVGGGIVAGGEREQILVTDFFGDGFIKRRDRLGIGGEGAGRGGEGEQGEE